MKLYKLVTYTATIDYNSIELLLNYCVILFQANNNTAEHNIYLELINLDFPNKRLNRKWYFDPSHSIEFYRLEFINCSLQYFQANAFNAKPFMNLMTLVFTSIRRLYIQPEMFNGISLKTLKFWNTIVYNISDSFLAPIHKTLVSLEIHCVLSTVHLRSIFGATRLLELRFVVFTGCNQNGSRTLNSSYFQQLPRIQGLSMPSCNIEFIQPETFDYIGETLNVLDVSFNRLKALDLNWFSIFLDWSPRTSKKYVLFIHNPFVCNCDFYEIQNLTLLLRNHFTKEGKLPFEIHRCAAPDPQAKCENLQEISAQKLNNFDASVSSYSFTAANLRISNGTLNVLTQFKAKFRLWIQNWKWLEVRKRSKCPSAEWLRDSVTCISFPGGSQTLPIVEYLQRSPITSVCAILSVANKRVWPLHIQSVYVSSGEREPGTWLGILAVAAAACAAGLGLGCIVKLLFGRRPHHERNG